MSLKEIKTITNKLRCPQCLKIGVSLKNITGLRNCKKDKCAVNRYFEAGIDRDNYGYEIEKRMCSVCLNSLQKVDGNYRCSTNGCRVSIH